MIFPWKTFLQLFTYMSNKTVKNYGIIETPDEGEIVKVRKDMENEKIPKKPLRKSIVLSLMYPNLSPLQKWNINVKGLKSF